MDALGRKWPCVVGMAIAGASFVCLPYPNRLAWLYVFRCIGNVGTLGTTYNPIQVDYFSKEDMGKLQAVLSIVAYIANLMAGSGAI